MLPEHDKNIVFDKALAITRECNALIDLVEENLAVADLAELIGDKLEDMLRHFSDIHEVVIKHKKDD